MHIVQTVPELSTASGGPSYTVTSLCDSLSAVSGLELSLVTERHTIQHNYQTSGAVRRMELGGEGGRVARSLSVAYGHEFSRFLTTFPADVVHVNGIWHPVFHWSARAARRSGAKVIIQPHGMLEPWSMAHQRVKKRLAWWLYQARDLALTDALVATSEDELLNLRRLGLRQPVALLPNGVHLPDAGAPNPERNVAMQVAARQRHMLFLSRLHPKKGVELLLEAWAALRPPGWMLTIAGTGDAAYLAFLSERAQSLQLGSEVRFVGELLGEAKWRAYRNADVFVLPTFSENFGVVVAEALAHGLPVITTKAAPWNSLGIHQCGWWIDVGRDPLIGALQQAISLDDDTRSEMGKRARDLAATFDWRQIAESTAEVYRWLAGQGPLPACVSLERE